MTSALDESVVALAQVFGDRLPGDPEFGGEVVHGGPPGDVEVATLDAGGERLVLFVGGPEVPAARGVRQLVTVPEIESEVPIATEGVRRRQRVAIGKENAEVPRPIDPTEAQTVALPSVST